ncbi:hypothetical protein ACOSQ3_031136 [Xanthoceras sorbifolium]
MDAVRCTESLVGYQREGQSNGIIIITRVENIASDMGTEKAQSHHLRTLNEEESLALFSKIAFLSDDKHDSILSQNKWGKI